MEFNAVYYSSPVVHSHESLAVLALVFDRVFFPGVYMPSAGVDEAATAAEIERIHHLGIRKLEDEQLVNSMVFALHAKHLKDFCVFTGSSDRPPEFEDGALELAGKLEELHFGPPPEGFFPTITRWFYKPLPGDKTAGVGGPSWLTYPANALLYAARNGLLVVNDLPWLPVPGLGGTDAHANAGLLATVLAVEAVRLVLPKLPAVSFEELADFRAETAPLVKPFRASMLRLSKDLNGAIRSDATLADVRREAKFLVETTVQPDLDDLREQLTRPSRPWYRRAVGALKDAPELALNFTTLPTNIAVAKLLARMTELLVDARDEQVGGAEGAAKRGALHYLLKVEGLA